MSNDAASEARDRLDLAQRAPLVRPRDRWVHAAATTAMGPVFGLYIVISQAFDSSRTAQWATVAFFVVVGAMAWWQTRIPTVPRHARRIGNVGIVGTVAMFGVGLAVLNGVDASAAGGAPMWLRALVVVVVAAPLVVSGALIARGPR